MWAMTIRVDEQEFAIVFEVDVPLHESPPTKCRGRPPISLLAHETYIHYIFDFALFSRLMKCSESVFSISLSPRVGDSPPLLNC
jgi:hypothetical protein